MRYQCLLPGISAHATQLSAGNLRSHVRVLAAQRVEQTQLPGDPSVSAAQEPRI